MKENDKDRQIGQFEELVGLLGEELVKAETFISELKPLKTNRNVYKTFEMNGTLPSSNS